MKLLLLACTSLSLFIHGCFDQKVTPSEAKFYSADSNLVEFSFRDYFLIPAQDLEYSYSGRLTLGDLSQVDQDLAAATAKQQIMHLYGVFTYHKNPTDFANWSGSILEDTLPKITSVKLVGKNMRFNYFYKDKGVFYADLIDAKKKTLSFYMPNSPSTIYKNGFPVKPVIHPKTKKKLNTCTSKHDNSDLAFFYYWSPDRVDCPKSFKKHIHLVTANLRDLGKSRSKFPEYEFLYNKKNKEPIAINIILGQDEKYRSPTDFGFKTFSHGLDIFKSMKKSDGTPTFNILSEKKHSAELQYLTDKFDARIKINHVFTDGTGWDGIAKDGLRNSDVLIFNGHSSEGYYFDLERIFGGKSSLPKNKYQIMFFNACTTSSYVKQNYFAKKVSAKDPKGTKYLDLITNAIGAPFVLKKGEETADHILVRSLLGIERSGEKMQSLPSWQNILDKITDVAGYDYTALTNIRGEKDNPNKADQSVATPK